MLDINLIRERPQVVKKALADRQMETSPVDAVLELDEGRRALIQDAEVLKAERNAVSKEIGRMKDAAERQAKIESMRLVGEQISQLDEKLRAVESQLDELLSGIPNIPDPRTPYGIDESENVVIKTVGEIPQFDFEPKPHWELGPELRTPAARPDPLDAGPARSPGLYREVPALHGQGADALRRRAIAQVRR
jgi:seryl-tRNA synthetase